MKKIKAKALSMPSLIILLLTNIFVALYMYGKSLSLVFILISFFFINLLMFFIIIPRNHFFLYDHNQLIVRNSIVFFKETVFNQNEIKSIEIKRESFVGVALKINLKDGKSKNFPTDISPQALEEMISDIMQPRKK